MSYEINVKGASFAYKSAEGSFEALKEIDLNIPEGEFVVLLGHNGSGKSTLAKLFNGFLIPNEGDITVGEVNTRDEDKIYDIRSRVGMVFQNPDNQMVASIIEDDIAFGCENLAIPRDEMIKRVDFALEAVGMTEYKSHTPFKLSGGQKQRIAIAAILAMLPSVLVLDESTAMLDPKGRKSVLEVVKRLNKERGMTIILITHYMDESVDADRVVVLSEGRIVKNGCPKEVFKDTEVIKSAKLELPAASKAAELLRAQGFDMPYVLTDEEFAEAVCQLL